MGLGPDGIVVATADGTIILTEIQPAGKKRMYVSDYVRGATLQPGERLGE